MALHLTASGRIGDRFKDDLGRVLSIPRQQADAVIVWLLDSKNPLPETPQDYLRMAKVTGIPEPDASLCISVFRYVLANWKRLGFSFDDLVADFRELAFTPAQVESGQYLFGALEPLKEPFWASVRRSSEESIGAPTVNNVFLAWSLRPIFASPTFPGTITEDDVFSDWLSHTYLLDMEVSTSRNDGKQESTSFQLTESDFELLERGFARARKQLEVLKSKRLI